MDTGLKTAMDEVGAGEAPVTEAVQLPLLPTDLLDGLPVEPMARRAQLRAGTGRAGRPPGAKNRSTEDWRRYLLSQYASPLEVLAQMMSRRTIDLADELGCKPVEALAIQKSAAAELAPYLHSRMPVEVNHNGALPIFLNIETGILADPAAAAVEIEEIQILNTPPKEEV